MSRRLVVIARTPEGWRSAQAWWHDGALRDVSGTSSGLPTGLEPTARIAVLLPPWAAARRVLDLPFRSGHALDDLVPLEMRGRLPADPGPSRVRWSVIERGATRTRIAAILLPEAALGTYLEPLAHAGLTPTRVDVAPLPAWQLIEGTDDAALVLVDDDAVSLSARVAGAPVLARSLSAMPNDAAAIAEETARSLSAWQARPQRILVGGHASTPAIRDAITVACGAVATPLSMAPVADTALGDDPVLVGALCALGRGSELPLAIINPPAVPRRQRRRLAALAVAAGILLLTNGVLVRHTLVRHAERLEAAVVSIGDAALPGAPGAASGAAHARLAEAVGALPAAGELALARLAEIGRRVPAGLDVTLRRLGLSGEEIVIAGDAATFDTAETLRRSLAGSRRLRNVTIEEMQARVDGAGVAFVLRAGWLAPGERAS